jgi:hypothetical protein
MLQRSSDRKTTNSATAGANVRIRNAFGLLSGRDYSCPAQTTVCEKVCYAGRREKQYPNVYSVMLRNFEFCRDNDTDTVTNAIDQLIKDFIRECDKHDAPKLFRIHHDGDFFSRDYATAWVNVIKANPSVTFWAYTRSFTPICNVVDLLSDLPNLTLYLSVDSDNETYASDVLMTFPSVRVATLADTADKASDLMLSVGRVRKGGACPEVLGRIPLITPAGGACVSCGLCVTGKSDIRFSVSGK